MFLNWRQILSWVLPLMCMAGTFTDKTFCLSLFTSNNPQTHLHSEGDGEIWRVKSGAGWQRERGAAFASEWNRSLVQVEGNERDLTTLGLAGITHGQNHNKGERAHGRSLGLCDRCGTEPFMRLQSTCFRITYLLHIFKITQRFADLSHFKIPIFKYLHHYSNSDQ